VRLKEWLVGEESRKQQSRFLEKAKENLVEVESKSLERRWALDR